MILLTLFTFGFIFQGCDKEDEVNVNEAASILPSAFGIDIPNSISAPSSSGKSSAVNDTLKGDEIYQHLRVFIHIGEGASEIVQDIMTAIAVHNIDEAMSLSYDSDEDGRTKNLEVIENSSFDGENWEFQLTITDAQSESNADGGNAIQVFWNRSPVVGIAVLKPYNINRSEHDSVSDAVFRIDYTESSEYGYNAHMIVSIAGLPTPSPLDDPYAMNNLKMFVGKSGNNIDVYGNSNHPNARFFTDNTGFNWAFVASGKDNEDIGVAEVGLPPSTLDAAGRDTILDYYAIKNTFTREIYEAWPNIDSTDVDAYLQDTDAPGYFGSTGFIQGGTSPGPEYSDLETRILDLTPFKPKDVSDLAVSFK